MKAHRLILLAVFAISLAPRAALSLTIELVDETPTGDYPADDSDGSKLALIMRAAADQWEDIIETNLTYTLGYRYTQLDGTILGQAGPTVFAPGGQPIVGGMFIDNDRSWFYDATPTENEEFEMIQTLFQDLLPADQINGYGTDPASHPPALLEVSFQGFTKPGAPAEAQNNSDMLSVVLHEFGHALGLAGTTPVLDDLTPDGDYDLPGFWTSGSPFSVMAPTLDDDNDPNTPNVPNVGHLAPSTLMFPSLGGTGFRRLPSATDSLVIAHVGNWGTSSIDLPRQDFLPGGNTNWNTAFNWEGNQVPGSADNAFVRLGSMVGGSSIDVTLSANGRVENLFLGNASDIAVNGNTLTVDSATTLNHDGPLPFPQIYIDSGGAFISNTIDVNGGALNLSGGTLTCNDRIELSDDVDGNGQFGAIRGNGIVNITTRLNNRGIISASGGGTLTFNSPAAAAWKLDANVSDNVIRALSADLTFASGGFADPFNGTMQIEDTHTLTVSSDWEFGGTPRGLLDMNGGTSSFATLAGGLLTFQTGNVECSGNCRITAPLLIQNGNWTLAEDSRLELDGNSTIERANFVISDNAVLENNGNTTFTEGMFGGINFTGAGRLSLNGNPTYAETVTVSIGLFDFDGDAAGQTHTVLGNLIIDSPQIDTSNNRFDDILNFNGSGSILDMNGPSTWIMNGTMNLNNQLTGLRGSPFTMSGTTNVNSDFNYWDALATISGTVNINGLAGLRLSAGDAASPNLLDGGTIAGLGSLDASGNVHLAGHGEIASQIDFDGNSALIADGGTLLITGTFPNSTPPMIGTRDDGILEFGSNWTLSPSSILRLDDGEVTGAGLTIDGSQIEGFGLLTPASLRNNGTISATDDQTLIIDGPAAPDLDGTTTPTIGHTLNALNGDIVVASAPSDALDGTFNIGANHSISLNSGGTLGKGVINLYGGLSPSEPAILGGAGLFVAADGTITCANYCMISSPITLGGFEVVELNSAVGASLDLAGPVNISGGTHLIPAGTTMILSDTGDISGGVFNIDGVLRISGDVDISGGTFNISPTGLLDLGGNHVLGGGTYAVNGTLRVSGSATVLDLIDINGNLELGHPSSTAPTGAELTVRLAGRLDVSGDLVISKGNHLFTVEETSQLVTIGGNLEMRDEPDDEVTPTMLLRLDISTFSAIQVGGQPMLDGRIVIDASGLQANANSVGAIQLMSNGAGGSLSPFNNAPEGALVFGGLPGNSGYNISYDVLGDGSNRLGIVPTALPADTLYVSSTANSGQGSLRQAIIDANGDSGTQTIVMNASLAGQTITLGEPTMDITDDLVIDGSSLITPVTISGEGVTRMFIVHNIGGPATATFRSLILRDGYRGVSTDDGGALINNGITTIEDCQFINNHAGDQGGAIDNLNTLTIRDTSFEDNDAGDDGGAIHNSSGASLTIVRSTFSRNQCVDDGGAIFNSGTLDAWSCAFDSNSASGTGGAMRNNGSSASASFTNTTFWNDSSGSGQAAFISGGTVSLGNSTISGESGGAGIRIVGGTLNLSNTIISLSSQVTGLFTTSISKQDTETINSMGGNLISNNLSVEEEFPSGSPNVNDDLAGTESMPVDPKLGVFDLHNGAIPSLPPLPNSPAIDAGITANLPADTEDLDDDGDIAEPLPFDQRSFVRVAGAALDIGAAEPPETVVRNTNDSGVGSFRKLVDDAPDGTALTFDPTVFASGGTITLTSGRVTIDTDISIDASALSGSGDPGTKVAVSGNNSSRVLDVAAEVSIDSVDIINGVSSNAGGISVGGGGAMLTIQNSRIAGNNANSSSGDGGGVTVNGTLVAENCLFEDNEAVDGGGSLRVYSNGQAILENCTITGSQAKRGAGAYIQGTITATHCTFVGNSASLEGGGFYLLSSGSSTTLTNCIIALNTAGTQGPDIFRSNGALNPMGTNLIGDNESVSNPGQFPEDGVLIGGGTESAVNPLLGALADNGGPTLTTFPLEGSPAIDAGVDTGNLPSTDQRGKSRIAATAPDLGAVEVITPTSFMLQAMTATINETETLQLTGIVQFDDATTDSIPFAEVSISSLTGPITNIAPGGLLTASATYQDEAAEVVATWNGMEATFALTILESIPDNYSIIAGDGVPDEWQAQNFTEAGLANALGHLDPDKDQQDNEFEWLAGSDPTDAGSFLSTNIVDVQQVEAFIDPGIPAPVTQFRFLLSHTTTHTHYRILHSPSGLGPWSPLTNDYLDFTDVDLGPDGFEIEAFHLLWTDKGFLRLELTPR